MDDARSLTALGSALRGLEPISPRLGALHAGFAGSGIADVVKKSQSSFAAMAEITKGFDEMRRRNDMLFTGFSKQIAEMRRVAWPTVELTKHLAGLQGVTNPGSITRQLAEASCFTAFADFRLHALRHDVFRDLENLRFAPVVADFSCIAGLYSTFVSRCETTARVLPPDVLAIPSREYFLSSETCVETTDETEAMEEESASVRNEVRLHIYSTVEEALDALDPRLLRLWLGAVAAAVSDNPDKVRHAITSLRELFTHVLHRMAPDQEIKKWTTDASHFADGNKPTRRARLHYILTGLDHDPFTDFLAQDVESTLSLVKALQVGTHSLDTHLSLRQMRLVFQRAGSTLCSIIEARLAID